MRLCFSAAGLAQGLCIFALNLAALSSASFAQERVNGAIQEHGAFHQKISPDEIKVFHDSEFKGAHKIAISVFNVAFPSEYHFTAVTRGHSLFGDRSSSAKAYMDSTMTGLDHATEQRIADKAYALLVDQLKAAGYEVVDQTELARLAPEFSKWDALPNFNLGRYGEYVAPTGQKLHFLQGDSAKRDTSGRWGQKNASFRLLDRPQAFTRSPYIARDANLGIVAVTLVIDYGVYSSSGRSGKLGGGASVGFKPGVAVAAGNINDSATLIEYWGPKSGGFPAAAYLQQPIQSDLPFGTYNGPDESSKSEGVAVAEAKIVADPPKFEAAADEVVGAAIPKLVSVMAAAR